jgi:hypothetical protein
MRYLAKTIADYIFEASKKPGTYKFIMPSYPSGVLVDIGNILEKSFGNVLELKVKFLYGIAYRLGQRWKSTALGISSNSNCIGSVELIMADLTLCASKDISLVFRL